MFSSRNIHFAILGIIVGSAFGYVFAFYQVQARAPLPVSRTSATADESATPGAPPVDQEHPEVTNDQMNGLFQQALEKNPNEPELMKRYGNFLYDLGRYDEAVTFYRKVLATQPNDIDVRTDLGTALYSMKRVDEAMAEYEKALEQNPNHMLALHNMVIALSDQKKDIPRAKSILEKMEQIDPKYEALPALRRTLAGN
jgi:cytochrome c-type biogenesis protein CcmH/NrfG